MDSGSTTSKYVIFKKIMVRQHSLNILVPVVQFGKN